MWIVTGTIHRKVKIMICIKCANEEFAENPNAMIEQEFKGELVKVKMTASACTQCGWTTVTLAQADELRRLTADAYRKNHGLLTSVQIKAIRKLLGKNQREFAAFLRVGEASVKRWETWLVQEKSSDQLIRMKCENEMRNELFKNTTTTVWVSMPYVNVAAYFNVPPTPAKLENHPRWAMQEVENLPANYLVIESDNCTAANEELALAA